MPIEKQKTVITGRLVSLDLFRGITMFLLVAEGTHLYNSLSNIISHDSFIGQIVIQFHHHAWNGLRFWDLIQPFFMFIVGVAMVFSLNKRWAEGASWLDTFRHIIKRCIILFFFGIILHCGYSGKLVWELWNVLTQLSFTILIAFLIFRFKISIQLIISFGFLLLTELLYRYITVPGYDQPFVMGNNFGSYMDMVLMGKINSHGWVAINCIPTAAHTIWGVLVGKILINTQPPLKKAMTIAVAGAIGLLIGYGMDWSGLTPIIKRISTSSFVIASGGWCLIALALCYWLIDIKGFKRGVVFFTVVGMNPIFIYMFSETLGHQWLNEFIAIFSNGFLSWLGVNLGIIHVINALFVLGLEWYLCYWLYKKRIFIKI
jgi:predicted acyltransferase